jgi:exosortase A
MNTRAMNTQALNTPAMTVATPFAALRSVAWPIGLGLLLLGGIFHREVAAAVQTWLDSTAYNHCFLVIPIAAYLLWDRRFELCGIAARPWRPALLLGVPLALVWLLAERLGIMEGRQLAAIGFVEVLFLAVLGPRLWWAVAGPLLYLYFLVPFGEFLTPQLQDITTVLVSHGLEVLGVPAYIDGYVIEIPQGTFFIAEACAGLRFLIASIAFGALYALIMYRSPVRRALFILASIVVPVFANGMRAIGIVYLGYLLDNAQAAAADHVIYGWLFFSFVILLLTLLGLPFRQDGTAPPPAEPRMVPVVRSWPRNAMATALALVAVAAVTPAVAGGLALATLRPAPVPEAIDVGPGCMVASMPAEGAVRGQRVTCGLLAMDMRWQAFSARSTAGAVMAGRRQMYRLVDTEGRSEAWLATPDGAPSAWRIMRSNDPFAMLAVGVWIDGKPVRPGMGMRIRMALDSLLGAAHVPLVVTVTPAIEWQRLPTAQRKMFEGELESFLLAHRELELAIGTVTGIR